MCILQNINILKKTYKPDLLGTTLQDSPTLLYSLQNPVLSNTTWTSFLHPTISTVLSMDLSCSYLEASHLNLISHHSILIIYFYLLMPFLLSQSLSSSTLSHTDLSSPGYPPCYTQQQKLNELEVLSLTSDLRYYVIICSK